MYANLNRQDKTAKRAFGPYFKQRLMIAAGRKIRREGVYAGGCNGDSGGPLVKMNTNTVVGITAFGALDCDLSVPTIFTKVAYYRSDISKGMQSALRMAQTDSQSPPLPISAPTITGNVAAGGTATCNPGGWLGTPRSFSYAWALDGEDADTDAATVDLGRNVAGRTLTCTVTATGSRGRTGKASVSAVISTAGSTTPGDTNPTVSWTSPANGATITKDTSLEATTSATGSAVVSTACLTINGTVPDRNYASSGGLTYGTYDSGTGCWTYNYGLGQLKLNIDTTPWTNGDYTFAWTVTDSNGRTSTTASRTFKVTNSNPTVSWTSPANGATITKDTSLEATTSATGSAVVSTACLTINGTVPDRNYASSGGLTYGTYDSGTGCWTYNYGLGQLKLNIDTTPWTNGDYTFAWTVTDSNGRTSTTASRTFKVTNSNPTVSWTSPANGATITGTAYLTASATAGGSAVVTRACLKINGNKAMQNYASSGGLTYGAYDSATGCWTYNYGLSTLSLAVNVTSWSSGNYTFTWTVTDSNGRTSTTASRTFVK